MDANLVYEKIMNFFKNYKFREYEKGEIVINASTIPEGIFCLTNGIIREYVISQSGEEITLNTFRPVSIFPVGWVVNDKIDTHYYEAVTSVTVFIAPKKEVLRFFKEESDVLFDLVRRIYKGLDGYFTRMEQLMSGTARTKLISEIIILTKRFGVQRGRVYEINMRLREKDLAAYVGITRETVNREMKKLKEKGLIENKKNLIIVHDLVRLEKELTI